jgi:ectoine hydroxylase-related dioxygenase (phytanoyl-CoA dioxygenase family)
MSVTPWHQDAALTRFRFVPRAFRGERLHFWIPLQDATLSNGCMEFVAGSHRHPLLKHRRFVRARGDSGLAASPAPDAPRVACPVRAGGFTVHTPGTLHYAGRNETSASRKAWIIHFSRYGGLEIALKRMLRRVPAPLTAHVQPA